MVLYRQGGAPTTVTFTYTIILAITISTIKIIPSRSFLHQRSSLFRTAATLAFTNNYKHNFSVVRSELNKSNFCNNNNTGNHLSKMCVTTSSTSNAESSPPSSSSSPSNPLLIQWDDQPFLLPPFQSIKPSHFKEAFESGMDAHLKDLQAIVDNTEEATFENTIVVYDHAGSVLNRVSSVFSNMCSSLNTDGECLM